MSNNIFNPSEHLIQLKSRDGSKDYLPVQWRLVWFREQCPLGTIDTEEMEVDTEREVEAEAFVWNNEKRKSEKIIKRAKGYARYKAIVTDGKGGRATGTKSENAANFADYVEKAETGSIGRALAALGYGTQFTGDEFNEAHRIVDAPVEFSAASNGHSNGSMPVTTSTPEVSTDQALITERQLNSIRKLSQTLRKNEPQDLEKMSSQAAGSLIQQLTTEYKQRQAQAS